MIDMHCHLLPGVDDGVKEMNEAIEIFKEGVKYGVTQYILTPHYRPTKDYIETTEELEQRMTLLREALKKNQIDVELFLGREIDEVKELKKLLENKMVCSMNDTSYLLVDFGVNQSKISDYVYEAKLLGYHIIVAHVERYKYLETHECFDEMKKEGAFLQVNASSIVSPRNNRMKQRIKYLFKNKLVDFVATDAHRNIDSYKLLEKAYTMVSKKYGKEYANKIFVENPKLLLKK
jgi:protein-tyrosine phosphatase